MSEVHIFAIIHAKPDTLDRVSLHFIHPSSNPNPRPLSFDDTRTNAQCHGQVKELLRDLSSAVHGNESYTLRYLATERIDGGGTDVCMFETSVPPTLPLFLFLLSFLRPG